jgi:hypothetical protein
VSRLDGLTRQEREACLIAERALGAVAQACDVGGRQGAVDAMLTLHHGRTAAFEITNLAAEGALHTASLLARDQHRWPLPGDWFWSIEVGSPKDLRRLKRCYKKIILMCERQGVEHPEQIAWPQSADPDLQWLVQQSSCNMIGDSGQLAKNMSQPGALVFPTSGGGFVDESMSGFADALTAAFQENAHIAPHFEKLAKAEADERHLFIALHESALPFSISTELTFSETRPREPPPLPDYITHLWLAPAFSRRVLLWCQPEGWRNLYPFDE